MQAKIKYAFHSQIWQHSSPGGWYFVTLPKDISTEIRKNMQWQEEGWGRLIATAKVGKSTWDTAIWYDTKSEAYLLPLKSEIRKKEGIVGGVSIDVVIWI